jgi:hypothetical protein
MSRIIFFIFISMSFIFSMEDKFFYNIYGALGQAKHTATKDGSSNGEQNIFTKQVGFKFGEKKVYIVEIDLSIGTRIDALLTAKYPFEINKNIDFMLGVSGGKTYMDFTNQYENSTEELNSWTYGIQVGLKFSDFEIGYKNLYLNDEIEITKDNIKYTEKIDYINELFLSYYF